MVLFASAGEVLGIIVVAALAAIGVITLFASRFIKVVQQGSVGVVKRLGEFKAVDQPGLHILAPFIDRMEKVDVREFPMTGDQQAVITKDNVSLQVSATIFCQVIDVKSALFEINDYQLAVDQLSRTALRAVFGSSRWTRLSPSARRSTAACRTTWLTPRRSGACASTGLRFSTSLHR